MTGMKRFGMAALGLSLMLACVSCEKPSAQPAANDNTTTAFATGAQTTGNTQAVNPLSGLVNLDPAKAGKRPVAVMINNADVAQDVQMGVSKAEIVYETLAEGGVTRMMAVFQDYENAGQIGTVRSARYAFTDLAMGMDAIYVHAGTDPIYNKPHMSEIGISHLDLGTNGASAAFREKNKPGLATEHTLYTTGEKLAAAIESNDFRTTLKESRNKPFFSFEEIGAPEGGASAQSVKVVFSPGNYYSDYQYNAEEKVYLKFEMGSAHKDLATKEQLTVKNIFILFTSIPEFGDGYHVNQDLSYGSGIYVSEGKATDITWEKGGSSDKLVMKNKDGSELKVNPGNSWINITKTSLKDKCVIE